MPYKKRCWCPHPSHDHCTRAGSKPTHPEGRRVIDKEQAEFINRQIICDSPSVSMRLKEGDKIYQRCYASLSNVLDDSFDLERMDIEFEEQLTADQVSSTTENISTPSLEEHVLVKQSAKEELNAVFHVLHVEKNETSELLFRVFVRTKVSCYSRRQKKIRQQVDNVYRYLQYLCDLLEDNGSNEIRDPELYSISINESNQILQSVKELFKQSTWEEQIRLMAIAPHNWGRTELSQWFGPTDHQTRHAIMLRRDRYVLAYPEYSRGNKALAEETIESVEQFYLQDDVSRVSSNTKDVLKINNELVPVRFTEMSIQEALGKFYEDNPTAEVGKSTFYSLELRQVKITCLHDTCMCQVHENMSLLLQVGRFLMKK